MTPDWLHIRSNLQEIKETISNLQEAIDDENVNDAKRHANIIKVNFDELREELWTK